MPHDRNGTPLSVGDKVTVEAEVITITQSEEYCNLNLKTTCPMPPYEEGTSLSLNAKQVTKI